jgi:hypothetical protein
MSLAVVLFPAPKSTSEPLPMSRSAARARAGQDRATLYSEITDKIIAELEAGRVPWVQPWGTAAARASLAMPKNAATQRRYSAIAAKRLYGSYESYAPCSSVPRGPLGTREAADL